MLRAGPFLCRGPALREVTQGAERKGAGDGAPQGAPDMIYWWRLPTERLEK